MGTGEVSSRLGGWGADFGQDHRHVAIFDGKSQIPVFHIKGVDEFLKGTEFMLLPIGVIKVFVEDYDGAGPQAVDHAKQHHAGR